MCQSFAAAQQLLSLELSIVEKQKLDRLVEYLIVKINCQSQHQLFRWCNVIGSGKFFHEIKFIGIDVAIYDFDYDVGTIFNFQVSNSDFRNISR